MIVVCDPRVRPNTTLDTNVDEFRSSDVNMRCNSCSITDADANLAWRCEVCLHPRTTSNQNPVADLNRASANDVTREVDP